MKRYNFWFRISSNLLVILILLTSPIIYAQTDEAQVCSEERLRNLTVAMLDCTGDTLGCSVNGGVISIVASNNIPQPHKQVIEQAASKFGVNPNFIAALFLSEQGNVWKPFDANYATSHAGASGPFQFMPGTWASYQEDGDGDGVADIMNFADAAHAASKLAATGTNPSTPLGDLDRPFAPDTLIFFSAVYNWGGGNVQRKTTPDSPITVSPLETQNYMRNIHALISSDFTQSGHPSYGEPRMPDGQPVGSGSSSQLTSNACVSGATINSLATNDPAAARSIILSSPQMIWGNYGSAATQRQDINSCLTDDTLFSIATMAESAGVNIPVNALATDHGGCTFSGRSAHNHGRAIDIGYYGSNSRGQQYHVEDGDKLYKFLFDNREVLNIQQLIWQYPPAGYQCVNNGVPGDCDTEYPPAIMDQHYHHIHVGFKS